MLLVAPVPSFGCARAHVAEHAGTVWFVGTHDELCRESAQQSAIRTQFLQACVCERDVDERQLIARALVFVVIPRAARRGCDGELRQPPTCLSGLLDLEQQKSGMLQEPVA